MSEAKTESPKEIEGLKTEILKILPQALKKMFGITEAQAKFDFLINPNNKKALGILSAGQVEATYMSYSLEALYGFSTQRQIIDELLDSNKSNQGKGLQAVINFEKASKTVEMPIGVVSAPKLGEAPEKKGGILGRFRKPKETPS